MNDLTTQGVLELHPKGYGFLRSPNRHYVAQQADPYVPAPLIHRHQLREGMLLGGPVEAARKGTGPKLMRIEQIEGKDPDAYNRRNFDDLTPIDPREQIILETGKEPLTTRVMDLLTPIGKGQRGLIVAPPRTGKTILLQHIAQAVIKNHPEMHVIMLLIDERPEEVTDLRRTVNAEVVASNFDHDTTSHIRTAELVVERAKRLAEQGKQAFVLLDSLTRLARVYNKKAGMGTALIETGSRMDDIIFQEFKGTGNMELVLDRKLADRRIFPAMDITQSGTRKEERILPASVLERVTLLRRSLVKLNSTTAMESLVQQMGKYPSNAAFLEKIGSFLK